MGYKDRFIEIDCSDLAEGCFVKCRNPKLASWEECLRDADVVDEAEWNRVLIARFIVEWAMWDRETEEELPVPSTTEKPSDVMRRIPALVTYRLDQQIGKALTFS